MDCLDYSSSDYIWDNEDEEEEFYFFMYENK